MGEYLNFAKSRICQAFDCSLLVGRMRNWLEWLDDGCFDRFSIIQTDELVDNLAMAAISSAQMELIPLTGPDPLLPLIYCHVFLSFMAFWLTMTK